MAETSGLGECSVPLPVSEFPQEPQSEARAEAESAVNADTGHPGVSGDIESALARFNVGAMLLAPVHAAVHGIWSWCLAILLLDIVYGLLATYLYALVVFKETVIWYTFFVFPPTQPTTLTILMFPILAWRAVYARHANLLAWRRLEASESRWCRRWLAWNALELENPEEAATRFLTVQAAWTALAIGAAIGPYLAGLGLHFGWTTTGGWVPGL